MSQTLLILFAFLPCELIHSVISVWNFLLLTVFIQMFILQTDSMRLTLSVLFSFTDVSGISLSSSPAQTKAPGQSVRLSCQISGYALTDYGTAWIRQPSGKALEWIGIIWGSGSVDSGNSFKSRFTISRDTGRNELYLDISSLQTEDTAVYYCAKTDTVDQFSVRNWQKLICSSSTLL